MKKTRDAGLGSFHRMSVFARLPHALLVGEPKPDLPP
jgi:hypothetical protein